MQDIWQTERINSCWFVTNQTNSYAASMLFPLRSNPTGGIELRVHSYIIFSQREDTDPHCYSLYLPSPLHSRSHVCSNSSHASGEQCISCYKVTQASMLTKTDDVRESRVMEQVRGHCSPSSGNLTRFLVIKHGCSAVGMGVTRACLPHPGHERCLTITNDLNALRGWKLRLSTRRV